MRQFINGTVNDYITLEKKAKGKCIRFKNQEFPPFFSPNSGDIGFEVEENSNNAILLVSRNISYKGTNRSINEWLKNGQKIFPSFDILREWLVTEIGAEFGITHDKYNDLGKNYSFISETGMLYLDEQRLFAYLKQKVIGQDLALSQLSKVTVRHCARKKPARPAVLFAVGPSGVGKTRTAEYLCAAIVNQNEDSNYHFLRLDMTEYQESHRVSQLIGAPQGYVGHGDGSQLTDAIRANPRTIILFDEIEKAHPSILRVLMNAMDAGRISSSSRNGNGYNLDFRYAIFVFTSNLDASGIIKEIKLEDGSMQFASIDEVCRRRLKNSGIAPEIIGRISRFLVYFPLSREDRAKIIILSIAEIAEEYGLSLGDVAPNVVISIMNKLRGNDFGARPAKFLIDEELGAICMSAAQQGVSKINIIGPPYAYEQINPKF